MTKEEAKQKFPKNQKKEIKNPLIEGTQINNWTILYRTVNSSSNHIQYVCQCKCGNISVISKTALINNKSKQCKECSYGDNLIGQKFGKLLVVSKALSQNNQRYWHCKCDCGNECDVTTTGLTTGHTQSCGCLFKEKQFARRIDLTGQKFGKLTALYPIPTETGDKQTYWHCKCDCGRECDVQTGHLRRRETLSCGCLKSLQEEKIIKLLNQLSISYIYQYSFQDFKPYKYDFFINNSYILEFDGKQHFVSYEKSWNDTTNVLNTHKRDLKKNHYCFQHNIPIIRIPYNTEYNINDIQLEKTKFLLTQENEEIYYKERMRLC